MKALSIFRDFILAVIFTAAIACAIGYTSHNASAQYGTFNKDSVRVWRSKASAVGLTLPEYIQLNNPRLIASELYLQNSAITSTYTSHPSFAVALSQYQTWIAANPKKRVIRMNLSFDGGSHYVVWDYY